MKVIQEAVESHSSRRIRSNAITCVALLNVLRMHFSNWILIDCHYRFKASTYICEKVTGSFIQKKQSYTETFECPVNMFHIQNKCIFLVPYTAENILNTNAAQNMCLNRNSKIFSVTIPKFYFKPGINMALITFILSM